MDNSSIYSVSYIDNGTEKPLMNGKVVNGVRTRWALTDIIGIKVIDDNNYKLSFEFTGRKLGNIDYKTKTENTTKTMHFICGRKLTKINIMRFSPTNISEQTLKPLNLPL